MGLVGLAIVMLQAVALGAHGITAVRAGWIPARSAALLGAVVLLGPVVAMLLLTDAWPASAWVPLHETHGQGLALRVGGLDLGGGTLVNEGWGRLSRTAGAGLRPVVTLHLASGLLGAGLLGLVTARIAGSRWVGLALGLAQLLGPVGRHAWLSETAGPGALPWLALLPVAAAGLHAEDRDLFLPAGVAGLGTAAVLGLIRVDLGLVALGVVALSAMARTAWGRALEGRWASWLARPSGVVVVAGALLALAVVGVLLEGSPPRGRGDVDWLVEGLDPADPAWTTWPAWLLACLPAGGVLLALVGWASAVRRPLSTGGMVALPWLYAAYHAAAHGGLSSAGVATLELQRYGGWLAPLALVTAAWGWRALAPFERPRRGLGLLLLIPPSPTALAWLHPVPVGPDAAPMSGLPTLGWLDGDVQRTGRALLARVDAAPQCATLVLGATWERPRAIVWTVLRPTERGPRVVITEDDGPARAVLDAHAPDAPCAVVLRTVDCDADERACPQVQGLEPLDVHEGPPHPTTHPQHGLTWSVERVSWGWFGLPGVPPGPLD